MPVLERKWVKINEKFVSRYQIAESNRKKVMELVEQGLKNKDIARILRLGQSTVSVIKRRVKS